MKINGNEIRPGHIVSHKGGLWSVVRVNHVKPGKGGAFAQVEMKHLTAGTKLNERFRSSQTVERVRLEQRPHQFLYRSGDRLTLMNQEDYEQIELSADLLGERSALLQDGMIVTVESHEGRALALTLPDQVAVRVEQADPVVKGQTAAASYKPAVLENGLRVMVPPFVGAGERIVIDTGTLDYVRRADQAG